jgi:CheY-like chemotaxis protein
VSKRKLLLADDSITIQKVVNLTFADEGIEVISVGDGDSAMIKIGENAPDLILADVNMPGLNGYQICERIKQNPETQKIPVILLVGSFEPFDEGEAYRVGADDYLTKPFQSIRQLVTKVSDLLESTQASEKIQTAETEANVATENEAANVHFFNTVEAAPEKAFEHGAAEKQFEAKQFDDGRFDDEMIQTSQVGSLPVDEIQKFIADSTAGTGSGTAAGSEFNDEFDFYRTVEAEEDFGKTAPLDIEDLRAFSASSAGNANGATIYEIVPEETVETNAAAQIDDEQFSTQDASVSTENYASKEQKLAESNASSPQTALKENRADFTPNVSDAPDFLFDDMNLLDLPPVTARDEPTENHSSVKSLMEYQSKNTGETVEQSAETEPSLQFENQSKFELVAETEKNVVTESADEGKINADAEIERQIAALSPELIEAIVRRVAEKMSDKAIREIAWEVVPQMTDLIVRRMAEEKFKE